MLRLFTERIFGCLCDASERARVACIKHMNTPATVMGGSGDDRGTEELKPSLASCAHKFHMCAVR